MADTVTVKVEGLRELGAAMQALGADVATKVARSATGAAAQVIRKRARRNIQASPSIESGSLLDAVIAKRLLKSQTQLSSEHVVTVRGRAKRQPPKSKRKQAAAPHASLVEFGTVNMPAEPFLRPAFDGGRAEALDAMVERIKKRIAAVRK